MRVTQISFFNLKHTSLESNKKPLQSKYPCLPLQVNLIYKKCLSSQRSSKHISRSKEHFNSEMCSKADPKDYTDKFSVSCDTWKQDESSSFLIQRTNLALLDLAMHFWIRDLRPLSEMEKLYWYDKYDLSGKCFITSGNEKSSGSCKKPFTIYGIHYLSIRIYISNVLLKFFFCEINCLWIVEFKVFSLTKKIKLSHDTVRFELGYQGISKLYICIVLYNYSIALAHIVHDNCASVFPRFKSDPGI